MKRIVKVLFILSLLLFLVSNLNKKETLAFYLFQIQSGSMEPEIKVGEVVFVLRKKQYKENDIITYSVNNSYFITHRIVEIVEEGYKTKGDSNNTEDENIVKIEQIQGKVIFHSKLLGILLKYRYYVIVILLFLLIL